MQETDGTWSRRRTLIALGSAGLAGIAGCSSLGDGDGDSDDGDSPPGTAFNVAFEPSASNYTITYEGDRAFDEDNTGLLAIDHVTETGTTDRKVWFGDAAFGPIEPGQSSKWAYDAERVTRLEVVWAPPGSAGSGREPEVLTEFSAP